MLKNILNIFLFLMMNLLLVSCASQKSIAPFIAADVNPELNSSQPVQKIDNPIAEKQIAVSLAQSADREKELKPVKEAGFALEQTTVSKAEPVPENAACCQELLTAPKDFPCISCEKVSRTLELAPKSTGITAEPLSHLVFFFINRSEISFFDSDDVLLAIFTIIL